MNLNTNNMNLTTNCIKPPAPKIPKAKDIQGIKISKYELNNPNHRKSLNNPDQNNISRTNLNASIITQHDYKDALNQDSQQEAI